MEGRFSHYNNTLATILFFILGASMLIVAFIYFYLISTVFLLLLLVLLFLNNVDSSYKASTEVIEFKIYYFAKYNINIEDITSIDIHPYEAHTRYGISHRVMLTIDTEYKTYEFNNTLDVKTAVDNMFLENPKAERPDEALTNLYYYITDIREELKAENKINEFEEDDDFNELI